MSVSNTTEPNLKITKGIQNINLSLNIKVCVL